MKLYLLIFIAAYLILLPSCASDSTDVVIKEKMFIQQVNDIYVNAPEYIGKTIKYEGVFNRMDLGDVVTYYYVLRYGPNCCGNDGEVGFEVYNFPTEPSPNDWVEVIGTLEAYTDANGNNFLRVNASSVTTLPERGNENVEQ